MTDIHLSREDVIAWRDEGRGDRERIVAHLASCASCRHLAAEIERARPAGELPSRFAAADFADAGYRARSRRPGLRSWWRAPVPLTAAALAAAALLAVLVLPSRTSAPVPFADDGVRGTSIHAIAPAGTVPPPVEFRWASPLTADRFLLEVLDADGRVVYSTTVTVERASGDAALARALTPGVSYSWRVTALSAAGDALTRSAARPFSVASAR